jgi:small subunit ribosomal protein S9
MRDEKEPLFEFDAKLADLGTAVAEVPAEPIILIDPTGRISEPGPKGYHWGTGRRKNAVARVRVRLGSGEFVVNGKPLKEYFTRTMDQESCLSPLRSLKVRKKVDVVVDTFGGGVTGQSGAVRMGLGRSLLKLYPDALPVLRKDGHMSRDPRMVERKKYGHHKARRGQQWGKR